MGLFAGTVQARRRARADRLWVFVLVGIFLISRWTGAAATAGQMTPTEVEQLRTDTTRLFYHGFDSYMLNAFPEDELAPLSCRPVTRDRDDPDRLHLNDVLGNYSLTLVDSLSTLAVMASVLTAGRHPLADFQAGVEQLVQLYGDGSDGPGRAGTRSTGFDLDSRVQVFETVIRGVGGLLSAHQFAVGDLPIAGYVPEPVETSDANGGNLAVRWPSGFVYDGQLLRLATDLATRLLPAFDTPTGMPLPRVNLRSGTDFYAHMHPNAAADGYESESVPGIAESTETCTAGAGSLVVELTTLSRLTGDSRFESAAQTAFWAVWARRSKLDLLGFGIDAMTGQWKAPYAGVGAGADSFFEYAFKMHVLLSGDPDRADDDQTATGRDYLAVFDTAMAAVEQHLFRRHSGKHPHFVVADIDSGVAKAYWTDSLSAFFPGMLSMAGRLEWAIETHVLFAAVWTRYSAMPERWSASTGKPEGGLHWFPGRPEFVESTWYLFRATGDPWFARVAEMVLRDIERRCWTDCGLAGLENVITGKQADRMESFFLSETAKYLFLTFAPDHPLHKLDRPFVFTTEGHPLVIPASTYRTGSNRRPASLPTSRLNVRGGRARERRLPLLQPQTCPIRPRVASLGGGSAITARRDYFLAAAMVGLELTSLDRPKTSYSVRLAGADVQSPNNFSLYPWTAPAEMLGPDDRASAVPPSDQVVDLAFPRLTPVRPDLRQTGRVRNGILVSANGDFRLWLVPDQDETAFRVVSVSGMMLGPDEGVFIPMAVTARLKAGSSNFRADRLGREVDLVIDVGRYQPPSRKKRHRLQGTEGDAGAQEDEEDGSALATLLGRIRTLLPSLSAIHDLLSPNRLHRVVVPASLAAAEPADRTSDLVEAVAHEVDSTFPYFSNLPLGRVCQLPRPSPRSGCVDAEIPATVAKSCQVVVVRIGDLCPSPPSSLLNLIPRVLKTAESTKLVVILARKNGKDDDRVEQIEQMAAEQARLAAAAAAAKSTTPNKPDRLPSVMPVVIGPSDDPSAPFPASFYSRPMPVVVKTDESARIWDLFGAAEGVAIRRKWRYSSWGRPIVNLVVV